MTQTQAEAQPTQLVLFDEAILATYTQEPSIVTEAVPDPLPGQETPPAYTQLVLPGFEERTEEKDS